MDGSTSLEECQNLTDHEIDEKSYVKLGRCQLVMPKYDHKNQETKTTGLIIQIQIPSTYFSHIFLLHIQQAKTILQTRSF